MTANLRDFPAQVLREWDIEPVGPDTFLADMAVHHRDEMVAALQLIAASWRRPAGTSADVARRLRGEGLHRTAELLDPDS